MPSLDTNNQKITVDIVIPAYNEEKSLKVLMPQLLKFCVKNDLKVIIVNDGSTDGTSDVLEEFIGTQGFNSIRQFFCFRELRGHKRNTN